MINRISFFVAWFALGAVGYYLGKFLALLGVFGYLSIAASQSSVFAFSDLRVRILVSTFLVSLQFTIAYSFVGRFFNAESFPPIPVLVTIVIATITLLPFLLQIFVLLHSFIVLTKRTSKSENAVIDQLEIEKTSNPYEPPQSLN